MTDSTGVTVPAYQQPFLELVVKGEQVKHLFGGPMYLIDVEGKIDLYIGDDRAPTALLIELCENLARAGIVVTQFKSYNGSAGPHFILRNGTLFQRCKLVEEPSDDVLAYVPRIPKYSGPR